VERDRAADAALAAAGWRVVRIWEHEALTDAIAAVTAALAGEE
jgi:DNA mismatch endonuclease (patch repair protein)